MKKSGNVLVSWEVVDFKNKKIEQNSKYFFSSVVGLAYAKKINETLNCRTVVFNCGEILWKKERVLCQ